MAAITWKNIDAPDFKNSMWGTALAGASFDKAGDTLSGLLDKHKTIQDGNWTNQAGINTDILLARAKEARDLNTFNAQKGNYDPAALMPEMGRQFDKTQLQAGLKDQEKLLLDAAYNAAAPGAMQVMQATNSPGQAGMALQQDLFAAGVVDPKDRAGFGTNFQQNDLSHAEALLKEKRDQDLVRRMQGQQNPQPQGSAPVGTNTVLQSEAGNPNAPRGVRNNNPGNLNFVGQEGAVKESGPNGRFAVFNTPEAGVAALDRQLGIYGKRDKIDTLAGVISKWAPPSENDTEALIKNAAAFTGFDPDQEIDLNDPATLTKVRNAIIKQEGNAGAYPSTPTNARIEPNLMTTENLIKAESYNRAQKLQAQQDTAYQQTQTDRARIENARTVKDAILKHRTNPEGSGDPGSIPEEIRNHPGFIDGLAAANQATPDMEKLSSHNELDLTTATADTVHGLKVLEGTYDAEIAVKEQNLKNKEVNMLSPEALKDIQGNTYGLSGMFSAKVSQPGIWKDFFHTNKFADDVATGVSGMQKELADAGYDPLRVMQYITTAAKLAGAQRSNYNGEQKSVKLNEIKANLQRAKTEVDAYNSAKSELTTLKTNKDTDMLKHNQQAEILKSSARKSAVSNQLRGKEYQSPAELKRFNEQLASVRDGLIAQHKQANPGTDFDTPEMQKRYTRLAEQVLYADPNAFVNSPLPIM